MKNTVHPSLYRLTCPHCNGREFEILGKKGALGKSIAISAAFGAIGNLTQSLLGKDDYNLEPTLYKCLECKKKFESLPLLAQEDEILSRPCEISFKRLFHLVGMGVSNSVWLNGVKMNSVSVGKTVNFMTSVKHNTVFVTDRGVAFGGAFKFEAQPGGKVELRFTRKFK
jgi:DNA-directed RNA polymerase subunit RPC12/RpoP